MLPRSEIEDYVAEDDEELQMALTDGRGHICPAAIGCIQAKHAKEVLNLPVRTLAMSDAFRKQLRAAFRTHMIWLTLLNSAKWPFSGQRNLHLLTSWLSLLLHFSV
jgi:hypothetical protein